MADIFIDKEIGIKKYKCAMNIATVRERNKRRENTVKRTPISEPRMYARLSDHFFLTPS